MKKLKLFFALFAMLALGVGNAWGAEAKFGTDWNSVFGTSYSGTISSVKANQLTLSGTVNSVSLVATNGTSTNGYVKDSDWRLYNGYTLTLTAPANHNITAISAKKGGKTIAGISTTVGDLSIPSGGATMSWTGSSNQVVFTVTTTMGFSEITVTYSEGGGSTPTPDPEDPDPENPTPGTGGDALSYTWDLSKASHSEATSDKVTWSSTDVNMVLTKESSSTNANNYLGGTNAHTRVYKSQKITFTPEENVTITSIEITATSSTYAGNFTGATWSNGTASTNNTIVTVIPTNGANAVSCTIGTATRATGVTVHYTKSGSGSTETVPSLTTDQFSWSATTATATLPNTFENQPTLTNTESLVVTYSSSNEDVAKIDASGNVTLRGVGTAVIKATAGDDITFKKTTVYYTLTVKPAPLVMDPIEGGIVDILTHNTFAATSSSYTDFTGKQATNENHSDAVYAGRSSRNGNSTQYSVQLTTIDKGRIATTTSGGLAKRVYVKWATQGSLNTTNGRSLDIYGSNTAFTGAETTNPSTKIGAVTFTTGAVEAYVDLTGDYKYILMTGSAAIYMDEIHVTWVSAAGTVVTPTISGETEFVESTEVSISTETGYKVYYTLDGTEPTNASTEYTAPFTVNATTTVKAIAYDGTSASDVVSVTLKKLQSLTCAEAADACTSTESTDKYVIRGYVTSIAYAYSTSDNNVTFWMADTKNGGEVLYAYRVKPEEETDKLVIVGDQVQVIGKIKIYSGKKEVNTGTYTITVPNPKYNVNITSAYGTVTATPASAVEGTEITLSVDVESGWVFQSWTVTDASSNPIEVVDNKFTMPASDVTVVAHYTESTAAESVLKLSANGVVTSNTYRVGETVELPANIANDCVKMFVGWSADANCATAPEYAPGADFELTATEHTLYAVYASGTTGETVTIKHNLPSNSAAKNLTGENDAATYFDLDASKWSIIGDKGGNSNNVGLNKDGTIRLYYAATGGNTLTITAPSKVATIKLTYNGTYTNAWVKVNGNKVTPTDGVYTIDAETFVIGNANTENVQVHIKNIAVTLAGALDNFSTTCTGALDAPTFSVAEGEYTEAKSITLSATEGTIYYTLDGTTPTSASTQYTEAIVLDKCGEYTIKAIAISSESESSVASATYTISLPIPANDEDNPYTGTEAIEVYNGGCYDGSTLVYVTGTVQEVEYSSSYGNYEITFVDGFQCYRLQKTATEKFTEDIIGAGDVIVVCGKLDKFGSNYQLAAGCYLVKHTPSDKADAELAWNPETVTLTVGDAFTAPTLSNPHSVSGITYESSNEDVATVSAEGVIALVDDAVGTATITATFVGDATYKPATATCTIQVNPAQEDCEGSDDFDTATATNASSYNTRTTEAGWEATNAAKTTLEGYTYLTINGKTSAVGTITSPVLNGGLGSIKIRYANTFSEANGVSFRLDIKQNDEVVKTYTITYKTEVTQNTVYTELIENINVAGDFQMVFTNLSPTGSTSNKDRVSIGRLCWTGYEEEETLVLTEGVNNLTNGATGDVTVNRSFIKDNLYTLSLPFALSATQVKAIFGANTVLYQFAKLAKEGDELVLYFSKPSAIVAGTPYLIKPSWDVNAFNVTGATITTNTNNISFTADKTTVTMKPVLSAAASAKTNGTTEYWLAADKYLYNNANTLLSLRALFDITTISGMPPRCRVALGENVETGVEDLFTTDAPVKVIENGQLIIIRDGVKYNVQGQKL